MRMTNRTKWRTDELRIIARRVAEQELESHERKMVHLTITTPFMNVKANQVRKARPTQYWLHRKGSEVTL